MPTIKSIVKQKRTDKCFVNLTDNTSVVLSVDLIVKYALNPKKDISDDDFEIILDEQAYIDVKKAAYNYASYKPRTEKQIRQKLKEKKFSEKMIHFAIEFLKEYNLFDDIEYAENYIAEIKRRKPSGKRAILNELLKKGVTKNIAEEAINSYISEQESFDLALKAAEKKYRIVKSKPRDKQIIAMRNFLASRGFKWEIINNTIDIIFEKNDK